MRRQGCRLIDRALNFSASCAEDGTQTFESRPCDFNDVTEIFLRQILARGRVIVTTKGRRIKLTNVRVPGLVAMILIFSSRLNDSGAVSRNSDNFGHRDAAKNGLLELWRDCVIPEPLETCTTSDRRRC